MGRPTYTSQKWPKLAISMGTYTSVNGPIGTGSRNGFTTALISTSSAWPVIVGSLFSSTFAVTNHKYVTDRYSGVYAASNTISPRWINTRFYLLNTILGPQALPGTPIEFPLLNEAQNPPIGQVHHNSPVTMGASTRNPDWSNGMSTVAQSIPTPSPVQKPTMPPIPPQPGPAFTGELQVI